MLATAISWLSPLLSPSQCELCSREVFSPAILCSLCERDLVPLPESRCCRCALPLKDSGSWECESCLQLPPAFEAVWAPWIYGGAVSELIKGGKYRGRPGLLAHLVKGASSESIETLLDWAPDGMVPVPLATGRLWSRAYNQSVILAEHWRRRLGRAMPICYSEIRRRRQTPQAGLNRKERLAALRGIFRIRDPRIFQNKRWLIVDDVMTTGATAEALCRCLLNAGARAVGVLVLARVEKLT